MSATVFGAMRPGRYVVKVQLSIASADGVRRLLIYPRDRSFQYVSVANADDARNLNGQVKTFVCAEVDPDGSLHLGDPAPWQDW